MALRRCLVRASKAAPRELEGWEHGASLVAPYVSHPATVKSDMVFTPRGSFLVSHMLPDGRVWMVPCNRSGEPTGDRGTPSPEKVGFKSCPRCSMNHVKLTRHCLDCGESLVYYPRFSKVSKLGLTLNRKEKKAAMKKARTTAGGGKRSRLLRSQAEVDPLLGAVRSSTSYYLYRHFSFADEQELMMAEAEVRAVEKGCNEKMMQPEIAYTHLAAAHAALEDAISANSSPMAAIGLPTFLGKYSMRKNVSQSALAVASALILTLAVDAGLVEAAKDFSALRHQLLEERRLMPEEVDHVMEVQFLKDSIVQAMYAKQSVLTDLRHDLRVRHSSKELEIADAALEGQLQAASAA